MKIAPAVAWGVVIYAVVRLAWSFLSLYDWTAGIVPWIFELIVLLAVCMWAGTQTKKRSWKDVLPYSFLWTVIAALLDVIFTFPQYGWAIYSEWSAWLGYVLVLVFPLLSILFKRTHRHEGSWES